MLERQLCWLWMHVCLMHSRFREPNCALHFRVRGGRRGVVAGSQGWMVSRGRCVTCSRPASVMFAGGCRWLQAAGWGPQAADRQHCVPRQVALALAHPPEVEPQPCRPSNAHVRKGRRSVNAAITELDVPTQARMANSRSTWTRVQRQVHGSTGWTRAEVQCSCCPSRLAQTCLDHFYGRCSGFHQRDASS